MMVKDLQENSTEFNEEKKNGSWTRQHCNLGEGESKGAPLSRAMISHPFKDRVTCKGRRMCHAPPPQILCMHRHNLLSGAI